METKLCMDHLAAMVVFARVVDSHGFSAAARHLGISKSAVSKQVARLEDLLGARLLQRTTRKLALTEVGRVFHEHCTRMLAEAEEAERAVTSLNAQPRGLLRVNAPMSFGVLHIAPALPEFLARHPEMRIDMTLNDRYVDLVDEGYDLAVRIARMSDSALVARKLAPMRHVVCATPDYLARRGTPKTPADLARHDCLGYSYMATGDDWAFQGPQGPVSVRVSGSLRANNGEALRTAALAGLGILRSPTFIVGPDLKAGRLKPVLCDFVPQDSAIYAVYPHRRHLTPKVRAFIDFLAERFGPEPYWDEGTGLDLGDHTIEAQRRSKKHFAIESAT